MSMFRVPAPSGTAETSYGSDRHGVVWAYRFRPKEAAVEVDSSGTVDLLKEIRAGTSDAFLWLHLALSNVASEAWLREHFTLPDSFYESLHQDDVSTRLEQEDDALVAVVHDVRFESNFDSSDVSTVSLYVDRQVFISVRRRPLRSVDRLRGAVKARRHFNAPASLLSQLLRDQADVLAEILRASTKQVDGAEDQLLANRSSISRRELGALRRVLVRLQRLLVPEPAALFRLLNRPPGWIVADDLQELRQAAEEFSTVVVDSAALVERIKLLQEEIAAIVSEESGRTLFVLTVVTVLALPINLVAGLFGMNVGGIPFSNDGQGFFLVVAGVFLVTGFLAYLALGRRRDR